MRQINGYSTQHWPLYSNFMGTFSTPLTELCAGHVTTAPELDCSQPGESERHWRLQLFKSGDDRQWHLASSLLPWPSTSPLLFVLFQSPKFIVAAAGPRECPHIQERVELNFMYLHLSVQSFRIASQVPSLLPHVDACASQHCDRCVKTAKSDESPLY